MTKKKEPTRYQALVTIWSEQHGIYIEPGTVVEFDLSDGAEHHPDIDRLIEKGAMAVYTGVWPIPEPEPETINVQESEA